MSACFITSEVFKGKRRGVSVSWFTLLTESLLRRSLMSTSSCDASLTEASTPRLMA